MDDITRILGEEGSVFFAIEGLKKKREEAKKRPFPEKKSLKFWGEEQEKLSDASLKQRAQSIVTQASSEIASMFSPEGLIGRVNTFLDKEGLGVRKLLLPWIQEFMEKEILGKEIETYNVEVKDIDNLIARGIQNKPPVFDPSIINVNRRFPYSRVGQTSDGKFFDKWLTDSLKEKRPIFFDSPTYNDKLIEFFQMVYQKVAEGERKAREAQQPAPVEEPSTPGPELPMNEVFEHFPDLLPTGEDDGPRLRTKIYRG